MIAYKVVRVEDKPWWKFWKRSVFSSAVAKGFAQAKYEVGKWADPPPWLALKGYYLTVFTDVPYAMDFVTKYIDVAGIWECEIQGAWHPNVPFMDLTKLKVGELILPEPLMDDIGPVYPHRWPLGTIMTKRVRLLRRVA